MESAKNYLMENRGLTEPKILIKRLKLILYLKSMDFICGFREEQKTVDF